MGLGPSRTSNKRSDHRRFATLQVEALEDRNLLSAYSVALPSGGGSFLVAQDSQANVFVMQGSTALFSKPRADVSNLQVSGTADAETVTIDFSNTDAVA